MARWKNQHGLMNNIHCEKKCTNRLSIIAPKGKKMDLASFLQDDTFGGDSWADDDIDFSSISIPVQSQKGGSGIPGPNPGDPAFGGSSGFDRRERVEFPVPDAPPYRARLNNLPWDANEEIITDWLESFVGSGSTSKLVVPRDFNDSSRLKGNAYVNFAERDQLVKALDLSGTEMTGRRVFVNVAAPEKEGFGRSREPVELDWGAARGPLPPREDTNNFRGGERGERRPRREEPNLDWGSARGSGVPSRPERFERAGGEGFERKPKREEPNMDWGAARTGPRAEPKGFEGHEPRGDREPRERKPRREEPVLDWGAARGSGVPSRPERSERSEKFERKPKREEPELDWGSARSASGNTNSSRSSRNNSSNNSQSHINQRYAKKSAADEAEVWTRGNQPSGGRKSQQQQSTVKEEEVANKPNVVKSAFAVLADEEDEEEEEVSQEKKEDSKPVAAASGLEEATSKLNVSGAGDEGDWEVVGKK